MHICILLATLLVVVVGVLAVTKPSKSKLTVIPLRSNQNGIRQPW